MAGSNSQINQGYVKDVGRITRERLYTKEELKQMRMENELTPEEVKSLATAKRYCDVTRFKKVQENREALIKSCLRLVISVARSLWFASGKRSVPLDDVIQAGNLGLSIAAKNYVEGILPTGVREAKFSTYAYPWIKKYVLDELNLTSQQLSTGIRGAYERALEGKQFTSKDDTTLDKDGDAWSPVQNDLRSDFKTGQEVLEIEDAHKRNTKILQRAFEQLTQNEKLVLTHVYGLGDADLLTHAELAKKFNCSTSGIHTIIRRAQHKIYWSMSDSERNLIAQYSTQAGMDLRELLCGTL